MTGMNDWTRDAMEYRDVDMAAQAKAERIIERHEIADRIICLQEVFLCVVLNDDWFGGNWKLRDLANILTKIELARWRQLWNQSQTNPSPPSSPLRSKGCTGSTRGTAKRGSGNKRKPKRASSATRKSGGKGK